MKRFPENGYEFNVGHTEFDLLEGNTHRYQAGSWKIGLRSFEEGSVWKK